MTPLVRHTRIHRNPAHMLDLRTPAVSQGHVRCVTPLALLVLLFAGLTLTLAACGDRLPDVVDQSGPLDTQDAADTALSDTGTADTAEPDQKVDTGDLCEPCSAPSQCGGDDDLCLTIQVADEPLVFCSRACDDVDAPCPPGYGCNEIQPDVHQCIPAGGSCDDPCLGVACDGGGVCDPETGECILSLEYCDLGCTLDEVCGGEHDLCVTLPDAGESICAMDCSQDPTVCPEGSACATINDSVQQCLPEAMTCVERCTDVECPTGQVCDPLSGACRLPLGLCDLDCFSSEVCGAAEEDVCLALPSGESYCALDCSIDPTVCPLGYFCAPLENGESKCVPTTLTCSDERCDDANCASGMVCDPATGICLSQLELCEGPCNNNNACLGPNDMCVAFDETTSFCAQSCDETGRCPLGYGCLLLSSGGHFCVPTSQTCDFAAATCTYETRFADCPGEEVFCSAVRPGDTGTCVPRCENSSCAADAPYCASLHLHPDVCLPAAPAEPTSCGRYASDANPVGRPCGDNLVPFCPDPTDVCYAPLDKALAPFCTYACATDTQCGPGASCRQLAGATGSLCVPDPCADCAVEIDTGGTIDLFGLAMTISGRTRCGLAITDAHLALLDSADRFVSGELPGVTKRWRVPATLVADGRALAAALDAGLANASPARDALLEAAALAGFPAAWSASSYTPDATQPLAAAVADLITAAGGTPDVSALEADAADVPAALQTQLAPVILAIADAHGARDAALAGMTVNQATLDAFFDAGHGSFVRLDSSLTAPDSTDLDVARVHGGEGYDPAPMVVAAASILDEIEAAGFATDPAWGAFSFGQDTPLGRVVITGNEDSTVLPTDPAFADDVVLYVDAGGDDVYRVPVGANTSWDGPVAVHIDLGGADTYSYEVVADSADAGLLPSDGVGRYVPSLPLNQEDGPVSLSSVARQGAGRFGIGILYDAGVAVDRYESLRLSQGFGLYGVGVLVDGGGADTYAVEALGQGAAMWGVGLLVDLDGDDQYQAWHRAQGAGATGGVGVLVDASGADSYEAVAGRASGVRVLYYNLYDRARSNFSASQGAGVGRAPNLTPGDDVRLPGGIGVLRDGAGDDAYSAAVLGQGAGAFHGVGYLLEGDGSDTYDGRRMVQGAGALHAAGLLLEQGGDDFYGTLIDRAGVGQGVGDDVAVGVFVEDGGDDVVSLYGTSGGAALHNGLGVYVDNAGADSYTLTTSQAIGFASVAPEGSVEGDPRRAVDTVAIFVDAGGTDTYGPDGVPPTSTANDASWTGQGDITVATEKGVGIDQTGATGL